MLLSTKDQEGDVDWNPLAVKFAEQMFYVRISRMKKTKQWTFLVMAQLLPGSCSRFMSRITVSSPSQQEGRSLTLQGQPCSLLEDLQADQGGAGLVVEEAAMKKMLVFCPRGEASLFTVTVEIMLSRHNCEFT